MIHDQPTQLWCLSGKCIIFENNVEIDVHFDVPKLLGNSNRGPTTITNMYPIDNILCV